MNRRTLIALASALVLLSGAASAKDDYVYGPAPGWSEYKRLGEAALRERLPDPDGWAIEWPNGYKQAYWVSSGHPHGYLTCGIARAVKPYKGGYPAWPFVVVIDQGMVKKVDFEPQPKSNPALICPSAVAHGAFPTAAAMEAGNTASPAADTRSGPAGPDSTAVIAGLGLAVRPMPDGAYVTGVDAGSPAAKAGLTPGTVITRANGIALAGLDAAMGKVLSADTPGLAIDTTAGAHLTLRR